MKAKFAKKIGLVWPVLLAVVFLIGPVACVTTDQARSVDTSGFLKDYSQLKEGDDDQALLVYINPQTDFRGYDKIMLDPVTLWANEDSDVFELPVEDRKMLGNYLLAALIENLKKDYTLVDQPGPGVMHLRTAITEAEGSWVVMDTIATVIPQLLMISNLKKLGTGTQAFVGKASVEAEMLDSQTGERLLAAVDRRAGGKAWEGKTESWADVKQSYDYWAKKLQTRLKELRARNRK